MNLSDLSAKELARIDAICLDYEEKLRKGTADQIDQIVKQYGGKQAAILKAELEAIAAEVATHEQITRAPFEIEGQVASNGDQIKHSLLQSKSKGKVPPDSPEGQSMALPESGTMVGPYLLGEELGRGGMGVVFKATDTRLDRQVAIKMLAVTGKHRKSLAERFQREAKSLAALSHPNIVELFDVGNVGGVPYAVMEYLQGESLSNRLVGKPLPVGEVRRLGALIADALTAAHAGGVVHRDLKPDNIMLVKRQGGHAIASTLRNKATATSNEMAFKEINSTAEQTTIVKLIDFGLSRQSRNMDDDSDKTRFGTVMGTPGYMSPEQARGEEVTFSTDIFGLGCVLFEAFYGKRAFDGESSSQRFAAVLESTPVGDVKRRKDDPALAEIIDRCLAKSVNSRPKSAVDIASALRDASFQAMDANTGSVWGRSISRRRFMESIGGAFTGAMGGQLLEKDHSKELGGIRSIAIVSFIGNNTETAPSDIKAASMTPVGTRALSSEEQIAVMLAQELQRIPNLKVRPFRPIVARTPEDFVTLGNELDVDAILTGLYYEDRRGSKSFVEITLQLVSSKTGEQIWTDSVVAEKSTSLLEQSELVARLAGAINQRLMPRSDGESSTSSVGSFECLAKGHAYLDADNSIEGLTMAKACFDHAIQQDARYPDAHAGLALTQIALATRGTDTDTNAILNRIQQARDSYVFALEIDPKSLDARFAKAILSWQTMFEYENAHQELMEISIQRPNDWRIHHQLGLLEMTQRKDADASRSLLLASQLNPQTGMVRTDLARLEWYSGLNEQAIKSGRQLLGSFPNPSFATGLLLDIYEELGDFRSAFTLLETADVGASVSSEQYFVARKESLERVPYGPFGALLNLAIFDARKSNAGVSEDEFVKLADAQLPALSMLLNRHPVFRSAQTLDRAKPMLSS